MQIIIRFKFLHIIMRIFKCCWLCCRLIMNIHFFCLRFIPDIIFVFKIYYNWTSMVSFIYKTELVICFSLLVVITYRSFIYSKKTGKDWVFKLQTTKKVSRRSLWVTYLMMERLQSKIPFFLLLITLLHDCYIADKWRSLFLLAHLFPIHPFSTPWKHQKTVRFSAVFMG